MVSTAESLDVIRQDALARLAACADERALQDWHVEFFGRKAGRITALFQSLGKFPPEERKERGRAANELKEELERRKK